MVLFRGKEGKEGSKYAGVAFIIHNELAQSIIDIEPITDRLMTITFNATIPVTLITVHLPSGDITTTAEEKNEDRRQRPALVPRPGRLPQRAGHLGTALYAPPYHQADAGPG